MSSVFYGSGLYSRSWVFNSVAHFSTTNRIPITEDKVLVYENERYSNYVHVSNLDSQFYLQLGLMSNPLSLEGHIPIECFSF